MKNKCNSYKFLVCNVTIEQFSCVEKKKLDPGSHSQSKKLIFLVMSQEDVVCIELCLTVLWMVQFTAWQCEMCCQL